jgi:hypothetical protein
MRDLRFAAIVDWIRSESPDVIFIEEGWDYRGAPSVAIPLAEAVGYDQFYRIGEGVPGILYDSNVILAKKKFMMTQTRETILPHSAFHIGDGIHTFIAFGPFTDMVGAKLTLDSGEPLFVYASHLLFGPAAEGSDQANGILRAIDQQLSENGLTAEQGHVLVAGDMNAEPQSEAMLDFAKEGFVDTWAEAHPDHLEDGISSTSCNDPHSPYFNPLTLGAGQFPDQSDPGPDHRIDYVLARGPDTHVLASTVYFTRPYGGFWMSDHYGVLSTLVIGRDPGVPVPNPLTDTPGDSPSTEPPAPSQVIEVTDKDFSSCAKGATCDFTPSPLAVGPRGFALVNKSSRDVEVSIWGTGRGFPRKGSKLKPGQASAFVFRKPGPYIATIRSRKRELHAFLDYEAR